MRTPKTTTNGSANCSVSAGGCDAHSGTETGSADEAGTAGGSDATVEVEGTGTGAAATGGTANGVRAGAAQTSTGTATCEATGGACEAHSGTELDSPVDEDGGWRTRWFGGTASPAVLTDGDVTASSSAGSSVDCGDAPACTGKATAATTGKVTGTPAVAGGPAPVRETSASSKCDSAGGGCAIEADSQVGDYAAEASYEDRLVTAAGGQPVAARELVASSTAGALVDCDATKCTGAGSSTTSGAASGDVKGVRDSTATSTCSVRGVGGTCDAASDTTVADRDPADADPASGVVAVSGPVSVSNATAAVQCAAADGTCGGTATSATSARDTAVSPHARGTKATADCTVTAGGCSGEATSAASSAPDYIVIDPETGLPVAGQPTSGPTSTSSSNASLECAAGANCSGTVNTSTAAWDGAVNGGAPRTSTGTASCTAGTGDCEVQSVSTASTGSGAALALAGTQVDANGDPKGINTARLTAGPSAASAAGAALTCEGESTCDGKVSSAATATDPSVSPDPRGSHSEGSCEGVTGGVCQAVTNSGASSGPDANVIAPLVQARSTANATVTEGTTGDEQPADQGQPGQDQPAVPPAPTAPGSSANSGGPTVAGASSWTMASATLDCAGGSGDCAGTTRTSAAGSDGPAGRNGANGARGPPAAGSSTSATCATGQSACQAQTSSTAGSGQVVADIVAEQQNTAAEQLAEQATQAEQAAADAARVAKQAGATAKQKKAATDAAKAAQEARKAATDAGKLAKRPVENAPATMAQSSASAQCAGPDCVARTTGATSGLAGDSRTEADCVAAEGGCAVTSEATAQLVRNAGQTQGKKPQPIPGYTGNGQSASTLTCPEAGCTGAVTGSVNVTAGADGRKSTSTATGATGCDGTTACQAQITAASSMTVTAPEVDEAERFVTTSATMAATCDNGTEAGCATRATSTTVTEAAAGGAVRGRATATCATAGACQAATGGFATNAVTEVTGSCAGTGCRTHTEGTAQAAAPGGINKAASKTDCTAGANGTCSGVSQVGANEQGAQVAATCEGSKGATCKQSIAASSVVESTTGGNHATANASCADTSGAGSGWCATSAQAQTSADQAMAAAVCQGSGGSGCEYSFAASSKASSATAGNRAAANASCGSAGGAGTGWCATSATAQTTADQAMAAATCQGSAGSGCRHSFSASSSASSATAGNRASANASCGSAGGAGTGWCVTNASAETGPGHAMAAASCQGSPGSGCSYSYRASSTASAPGAYATATGYGAGGVGGGMAMTTAMASGGGGAAQAAASCMGSPGTNCSHYYEATASAYDEHKSGSWARAYAHGSGGGGMGGGGVAVMAYAVAGEGFANAGASCSGAANCAASYSAHAEAYDELVTPYGKYTAEKWATCSGSGNGGCGVWAVAIAGPDGVADAGCSGDGGCDVGGAGLGFIQAKIDTSGLGMFVDEQGNPIPIEDVDPDHAAVRVVPGENGDVVIEIKPRGTNEIKTYTCAAPCVRTHEGITGGNDNGQNNPNGDYHAEMPVEGKPGREHQVRGENGVGIAQDAQGNAEAWVRGRGAATDGRTGDRIVFTRQAQAASGVNNIRFGNKAGSPFASTCNGGCEWWSPTGEHLKVDGNWGNIQAQDAKGSPARIQFHGGGHFTNEQGDIVHADQITPGTGVTDIIGRGGKLTPGIYSVKGTTGYIQFNDPNYNATNNPNFSNVAGTNVFRIAIDGGDLSKGIKATTPDKNGMGGTLWCEGNCTRTMPGVPSDGSNGHMYDPVTTCDNCRITEQLPTGTGRFPWGHGSVELFDNSNGLVSRYTPWGDKQTCAAGAGGRCGFTQYNRSLDDGNPDAIGRAGQGGGAICNASGEGGGCYGMNAEGDYQNAVVTLKDDVWVPVRTGLLYRMHGADAKYGEHAGRFCAGESAGCNGGGAPVYDAPPDANGAMVGVLDPSLRISPEMAQQLSELKLPGGGSLNRKADDRSPLTALEIQQLEGAGQQDVLNAYNRDLPLSQAESDGAEMSWFEDTVTMKEMAPHYEALEGPIDDLATLTEDALAGDDFIDAGEWADIKPVRDQIDAKAPGMLERWMPAQTRLQLMRGAAWTLQNFRAANAEVGNDPELIEHLLGEPYAANNPARADQQQRDAIDEVARQQLAVNTAQLKMHTDLGARTTKLNDRITIFNNASQVVEERGGPNPGEAIWLYREYNAITAEQDSLAAASRPYQAKIDAAEQTLRTTDLAYADASGNEAWARDLDGALNRHNRINGLYQRLSVSSQPRQQELSETFSDLTVMTELRYSYVRDMKFEAPANYEPGNRIGPNQSLLGGRALPSTMLNDFAAIHTGARLLDDWKAYDGRFREQINNTMSLDEQAELAAFGVTPQMKEAELLPREINENSDGVLRGLIGDEADLGAVRDRIDELSADGRVEAITMPYQNDDGSWTTVTLFRVKKEDGDYRFVDQSGAHFGGLEDFRENNEIVSEKGTLIANENLDVEGLDLDGLDRETGEAPTGCNDCDIVETTGHTKASGWDKWGGYVVGGAMIVGGVLLWAGGGIVTLATLGAASPLGAAAAIGGTALITGGVAYTTVDAISNINNRSAHGQSNSFSNPAARADYLSLAGNVLTVVGVGVGIKAASSGVAQYTARVAGGSLGVRGAGATAWQRGMTGAPGWAGAHQAGQMASGTTWRGLLGLRAATPMSRVAYGANAAAFGTFGYTFGEGVYSTAVNWDTLKENGQLGATLGGLAMNLGMLGMPVAFWGASRATGFQGIGLPRIPRSGGPATNVATRGADAAIQSGSLTTALATMTGPAPGRSPVRGGVPTGPNGRPLSPRQLVRAMGDRGVVITRKDARIMLAEQANLRVTDYVVRNQGVQQRLTAPELAEQLGISTSQARDALRAINGSRLVEYLDGPAGGFPPVCLAAGHRVRGGQGAGQGRAAGGGQPPAGRAGRQGRGRQRQAAVGPGAGQGVRRQPVHRACGGTAGREPARDGRDRPARAGRDAADGRGAHP